MKTAEAARQAVSVKTAAPSAGAKVLQRACACGTHVLGEGECGACRKQRDMKLQRSPSLVSPMSDMPPIVHDVLRSSGRALDSTTRDFMEQRFGHDFSRVRVHSDSQATSSARAVGALAYTVGPDIVLGASARSTGMGRANALLAHELAHVVQQSMGGTHNQPWSAQADETSTAEQEARRASDRIVAGGRVDIRAGSRFGSLQCQSDDEYHGIGGWLHKVIYEPLQRGYSAWISKGIHLAEEWNDEMPILGYVGGTIVEAVSKPL
jgi:hypothetical protein